MTLRGRIGLVVAAAVAITIVGVSAAAWFATRTRLRGEIDEDLRRRASVAAASPRLARDVTRPIAVGPLSQVGFFVQVVGADRSVASPSNQPAALPVDEADLDVALRPRASALRDVEVAGRHLRMITVHAGPGVALQLARSLAEVDASLRGLALLLLLVSIGGVALAGGFGYAVARGAVAPIARLTRAAEHVAATEDLEAPIEIERDDEVGRLAGAFNRMLAALADSRRQQRRLVADASHELRTPLTSLRTNIEVLAKATRMPARERREILADVTAELEDLGALVAELVDLATDPAAAEEDEREVDLAAIAHAAADRAQRRTGRTIEVDAAASLVRGRAGMLERAIANLLDNACKWGPEGEPVRVRVAGGRVEVEDAGPGIAPADRARVFDRFWRADAARGTPGSGLGLAIVRHVAESHDGEAFAGERPGGGAVVGFEIPSSSS